MKNKGQALVEFIIILPVFLIMIFGISDFARVILNKNNLENLASDVITFYENGKAVSDIENIVRKKDKDIKLKISDENSYTIVSLEKKINPITPGFNYLPNKIFDIKIKRFFNLTSEVSDETNAGDLNG